MTPLEINFLLHCYCRADIFENIDAPIMPDVIEDFLEKKLIRHDEDHHYRTTTRGDAHVKQLMECALPEPAYVVGNAILWRGPHAQ